MPAAGDQAVESVVAAIGYGSGNHIGNGHAFNVKGDTFDLEVVERIRARAEEAFPILRFGLSVLILFDSEPHFDGMDSGWRMAYSLHSCLVAPHVPMNGMIPSHHFTMEYALAGAPCSVCERGALGTGNT